MNTRPSPKIFSLALLAPALCGPLACYALMTGELGNKELSAANYTDWPGLVDAINDKSRVRQVWVNGNESFSYSGDTEALNRVLKKFAATDVPRLNVILRPGPGQSVEIEGKKKQIGWRIQILGGIAKASVTQRKLDTLWHIDPTLTVYVTDMIDLGQLEIPEKVNVLQVRDLRKRYKAGLKSDDERVKKEAANFMKSLEDDAKRDGDADAADRFKGRVKTIRKFVAKRRDA